MHIPETRRHAWARASIVVLSLVATATSAGRAQTVHYVDDDAPLGGDGVSWGTAFTYLQDALAAAEAEGEIRVAAGVYKPDQDEAGNVTGGDRGASFRLLTGVAILGGYAGVGAPNPDERDIAAHQTTLTGDLAGDDGPEFANRDDNAYHVLIGSDTDSTAILDGVTVTGGHVVSGDTVYVMGGGLYVRSGSPTIRQCTFHANYAAGAGGVYSSGGSPIIEYCTFTENASSGVAGAVYASRGEAVIRHCLFKGNRGDDGGAIYAYDAAHQISDCTFIHNVADDSGGALSNYEADTRVTNCQFLGNRARRRGGAMNNSYAGTPHVVNCLFAGNWGADGGAMCNFWTDTVIVNCVMVANSKGVYNASAYGGTTDPRITNCIIWGNGNGTTAHQISRGSYSSPVVNYSLVQGGWSGSGGIGILDVDPEFRRNPDDGGDGWDPADDNDDYGDLRLRPFSPCIDAGDGSVDVDTLTPGVQPLPDTDLAGGMRAVDDPTATDAGPPPPVDLGPLEYQEDCNDNSILDSVDLFEGTSGDCNENLIPDDCELPDDCDFNDVQDICDIAFGDAPDCNLNNMIDACDIAAGRSSDNDDSGIPDECERTLTGYWRFDFTADTGCYWLDRFSTQVRYFRFDENSELIENWALTGGRYLKWQYPSTDGASLNRYLLTQELTANTDRTISAQSFVPYPGLFNLEETVTVTDGTHEASDETPEAGTTGIEGEINFEATAMQGDWEFGEYYATLCGNFTATRLAEPPPDLPYVIDLEAVEMTLSETALTPSGTVDVSLRGYRIRASFVSSPFEIRYFLSVDTALGAEDTLLGGEWVESGPDGTVGLHGGAGPTLNVPQCVPWADGYHVLAVIDAGDSVAEVDESNNIASVEVTISPPPVAGDVDCDGDVDLEDFIDWGGCMTGPDDGPLDPGCGAIDFELDGDVDLVDFARFQSAFE